MFIISWFRRFFNSLRSFARNESGMTLPMLGLSMIVLTGMTGMAIDIGRLQMVQAKLQFSLDAAGLAAGSTVNTANVNTEVSKYLNANFNGYLGATLTGTAVTVSADNSILTLTATASLGTTFLQVLGISTMTTNAHTQITRNASGLELVLALDVTGSMTGSAGGGVSKISALRTAAAAMVNSLFGSGTSPSANLFVGIVPFSQAVNIGSDNTTWLDTYAPDWGPASWGGCVDARVVKDPPVKLTIGTPSTYDQDVSDDPPATTKFRQYYFDSDGNNPWRTYEECTDTWQRCKNGICKNVSPTCSTNNGWSCTQISDTCQDVTLCTADQYTTCGPAEYNPTLNNVDQGPNLNCPQKVTRMTTDKAVLLADIASLEAQGNTHIPLGLSWAWRMLSPKWQGIWGGSMNSNSLPKAYNTPHMSKAVVLLTDGDNTISNGTRGAYDYLGEGMLGTSDSSSAETQLNRRTKQLCALMKANNIYIYTIALGTNLNSDSLAMLSECATSTSFAFVSPSTTQLQGIFNTISDSLSNLRVSQ